MRIGSVYGYGRVGAGFSDAETKRKVGISPSDSLFRPAGRQELLQLFPHRSVVTIILFVKEHKVDPHVFHDQKPKGTQQLFRLRKMRRLRNIERADRKIARYAVPPKSIAGKHSVLFGFAFPKSVRCACGAKKLFDRAVGFCLRYSGGKHERSGNARKLVLYLGKAILSRVFNRFDRLASAVSQNEKHLRAFDGGKTQKRRR